LRATQLDSLLEVFNEFKDCRRGHGLRHRQPFVLACAAVAMLLGAGGYEAFEDECMKLTQRLLEIIRNHWSGSENGSHYRRDVSLGEDASRISGRNGAFVMATLRNLLLGLFELQKHRGRTQARTFPAWRRKLTHTQKIQLLTRTL
jgi:predicted transposase YbfD/YdcC